MKNIDGWRVTLATEQSRVVQTFLFEDGEGGFDKLPAAIFYALDAAVRHEFLALEVMARAVERFQDSTFRDNLSDECYAFVEAAKELSEAIDKWRGRHDTTPA